MATLTRTALAMVTRSEPFVGQASLACGHLPLDPLHARLRQALVDLEAEKGLTGSDHPP